MILNHHHTAFLTVYGMTPFDEKKYFLLPIWRHHRNFFFFEKGSYHIPLESSFNTDSESSKNHGLKMKSWRDILISILSCDVTWPNWNRNNSPALHFQTMVFMWFWISVILAFQRYITWPPLEKKIFFSYYDVTCHELMTSRKNGPIEIFKNYHNAFPQGSCDGISINLRWVFFTQS